MAGSRNQNDVIHHTKSFDMLTSLKKKKKYTALESPLCLYTTVHPSVVAFSSNVLFTDYQSLAPAQKGPYLLGAAF